MYDFHFLHVDLSNGTQVRKSKIVAHQSHQRCTLIPKNALAHVLVKTRTPEEVSCIPWSDLKRGNDSYARVPSSDISRNQLETPC